MDDPFAPAAPYCLSDYRLHRIVLSPSHWRRFSLEHELRWRKTKFTKANALEVPDDQSGVYSFLVHPGIANHDACGYLMYVGKAERQSLRKRFKQYLKPSDRTHIGEMMRLWRGHIWFHYATMRDPGQIDGTEQALLSAYLPPFNHSYRGEVSVEIQKLFSK